MHTTRRGDLAATSDAARCAACAAAICSPAQSGDAHRARGRERDRRLGADHARRSAASRRSARAFGPARASTSSSIGGSPTTPSLAQGHRRAADLHRALAEHERHRHDRRRLLRRSRRRARHHRRGALPGAGDRARLPGDREARAIGTYGRRAAHALRVRARTRTSCRASTGSSITRRTARPGFTR